MSKNNKNNAKEENEAKEMVAQEATIENNAINGGPENEPAVDQAEKDQNGSLPENVSLKPQDREHADLRRFKDPASIAKVYVPVSDDAGDLHGDKELEQKVIDVIDLNKDIDLDKVEDLDALITELADVSVRYTNLVNITDAISSGTISKYRIRQGMLFNILKPLVIKNGQYWIPWFEKHFNPRTLRSVEVYMSIAKIPNVIRYAFLDLERLKDINRAIKGYSPKDDDPIAKFLDDNKISIDFEGDDALEEFKIDIDCAIASSKINKTAKAEKVEMNVDLSLVRKLVAKGKNVDTGDMVIIAQSGGDVNKYLDSRYLKNAKQSPEVISVKTVTGFPKLVAEIKSSVKFIEKHPELAEKIDKKHIKELEVQIAALKRLHRAKSKKE